MGQKKNSSVILLLEVIEEAYHKKAWHGTNLRGAIRGLSPYDASWRPAEGRHNIWEIALHCAYWKYAVRRRILGEKKGSFPLKGSDWFTRPVVITDAAWKQDIALLEYCHQSMIEAIAQLCDADLASIPKGSSVNNRMIISGISAHDLYHAGQIQILKRLLATGT